MDVEPTPLPGVLLIKPRVFGDARGFFMESWNTQRYAQAGLPERFVQDNVSRSARGVLRGLHFQDPHAQGKLVGVLEGEVFDVAVDIRRGSPSFGRWVGYRLNDQNRWQLYVPPGFAHGFYVTSETALFQYKCTDFYAPQCEHSLRWDDPAVDIHWPAGEKRLSDKDAHAPTLEQLAGALPAIRSAADGGDRSPSDRPRILLFGSEGQVGSALAEQLPQRGQLITASRRPQHSDEARSHRCVDLSDPAAIAACIAETDPQVIVNAAAYTAVDRAEQEPDIAERINHRAPAVMAEAAAARGAALVHYCTDYVFSGRGTRPWRESDIADPQGVYAATKLRGTRAVLESGAAALVLRVCWVYDHRGQNFLRSMLRLGAERSSLSIVADQFGAPTSARQIAAATCEILACAAADSPAEFLRREGGLFHFSAAGETTWYEYAQHIFSRARHHGLPLQTTEVQPISSAQYPTAAARPHNSRLDCRLISDRFAVRGSGWQPEVERTLGWIADRRARRAA